jgi:hypothetical protein
VLYFFSRLCYGSPMTKTSNPTNLLDEIEAQQDEVLLQLDELNGRIETLLREFTRSEPVVADSPAKAA